MNLETRLDAFEKLGKILRHPAFPSVEALSAIELGNNVQNAFVDLQGAIEKTTFHNPWFIRSSIIQALSSIGCLLHEGALRQWIQSYTVDNLNYKTIAVILAGNIPVVGFHDFLCVILSGNTFLGKLSSSDPFLLPSISRILIALEPELEAQIQFAEGKLSHFDAVLATGSDNSSRYFDYYFGKYPHIIRKNRHSVAVLDGSESDQDLHGLSHDIFDYFGLGCRSVSMLYLPEDYAFERLMSHLYTEEEIKNHSKYLNNYEYNKALFLINGVHHYDNGYCLVTENESTGSPVSVVHYRFYKNQNQLSVFLKEQSHLLQCVVAKTGLLPHSVGFGKSQQPKLHEYADGVDVMSFLLSI